MFMVVVKNAAYKHCCRALLELELKVKDLIPTLCSYFSITLACLT